MKSAMKQLVLPILFIGLFAASSVAQASYYKYSHKKQSIPTITGIVLQSGGAGKFDDNNSDYDLLLNAVIAADLADALADPDASLTVFAPTDAAFIALAQDLGYAGDDEAGAFDAIVATLTSLAADGNPIPILTDILLYHVSPDAKYLSQTIYSKSIDTLLTDATITPDWLNLVDNEPEVTNPRFIRPVNLTASNGVIHTINRVLLPIDLDNSPVPTGNIVDIVVASGGDFDNDLSDFDILLTSVLAADLAGALSDATADLTVFAPNDAAFLKLARDLGYRGHDEAGAYNAIVEALTGLSTDGDPIPVLKNILLYHVSPVSKSVKEVSDLPYIKTLLGVDFTAWQLYLVDQAPKLRAPKILTNSSNIAATNGTIHTISRVLIPLDLKPVPKKRRWWWWGY